MQTTAPTTIAWLVLSAALLTGPLPAQHTNAASLEVIDAAGYVRVLKEHRGRPVMVYFWATWCEPCRVEFPIVNELAREYAEQGLVVVGISVDDDLELSAVRRFLERHEPRFANFRKQPDVHAPFYRAVEPDWKGGIPATFFYDRKGQLAGTLYGEQKREDFEAAIQKLLKRAAADGCKSRSEC